jgi:hypothetical protein
MCAVPTYSFKLLAGPLYSFTLKTFKCSGLKLISLFTVNGVCVLIFIRTRYFMVLHGTLPKSWSASALESGRKAEIEDLVCDLLPQNGAISNRRNSRLENRFSPSDCAIFMLISLKGKRGSKHPTLSRLDRQSTWTWGLNWLYLRQITELPSALLLFTELPPLIHYVPDAISWRLLGQNTWP